MKSNLELSMTKHVCCLQAATMLKFPAPLSLVVITSVMGSSLTALLQLITEGKISVGPTTMSFTSIVAIVLLVYAILSVFF